MKVLVSGSHGLIGSQLAADLEAAGHVVHRLVRSDPSREGDVRWAPMDGEIDRRALAGHDAVVHLAGESLDSRWTKRKRAQIRGSRILGTGLLASELAALDAPPRVLVCASAVGYYGDQGDRELDEDAAQGDGFLAGVVREWEQAAEPARAAGIRTVTLRQAVVLSPRGGALGRLMLPFRMGVGGRVGSGRQYWSWIGLHELTRLMVRAIEDESMDGVYNAAGPEAVTNAQFTKALAGVLHRPAVLPVPPAGLRLWLGGDLVDEMLLASQRVVPRRLTAAGYDFLDDSLEAAIRREARRAAGACSMTVSATAAAATDTPTATATAVDTATATATALVTDPTIPRATARIDELTEHALAGRLTPARAIDRIAALAEGTGDRRSRGSFFTPEDVTRYMAAATIVPLLARPLVACGALADPDDLVTANADLVEAISAALTSAPRAAVDDVSRELERIVVLDPTCGAGAFLVAAVAVLRRVEAAVASRVGRPARAGLHLRVRGADSSVVALRACRAVLAIDVARADGPAAGRAALGELGPLLRELDATCDLRPGPPGWLPARGVDAVLGNPPYVRASAGAEHQDLATRRCGNLYAWVTERALAALAPGGRCGLIVPISSVCTDAFEPFREVWRTTCDRVWVSNFDTIPATLFPGTVQRVSIFLGQVRAGGPAARHAGPESRAEGAKSQWHVTAYRKWRKAERAALFPSLAYVPLPPQRVGGSLPKVGSLVEHGLLERLFSHPPAGELLVPQRAGRGDNRFWYKRRWSYFLLFLDWVPELRDAAGQLRDPSEFKPVDVVAGVDARALLAAYNSSLFYWFFTVFSDNRNVNRRDLAAFPFGRPTAEVEASLAALADELMVALRDASELRTCTYRSIGTITNTYFRQARTKPVLDRIDAVLARHYGLDDDQLAFVTSFEAAVRMPGEAPRTARAAPAPTAVAR